MSTTYNGRTFDYIHSPDIRNFLYTVSPVSALGVWNYKYWVTPDVLDQGEEGACVGHGVVSTLASSPILGRFRHLQSAAFGFYSIAKFYDEFHGENYDGTSVRAGLQVAMLAGHISGYLWMQTLYEVLETVATKGPVVIGVEWKDSMMEPGPSGLLDCSGQTVGGHCVSITGVNKARMFPTGTFPVVRIRQSWGKTYADHGNVWMKWDDLAALMLTGEVALPVR